MTGYAQADPSGFAFARQYTASLAFSRFYLRNDDSYGFRVIRGIVENIGPMDKVPFSMPHNHWSIIYKYKQ